MPNPSGRFARLSLGKKVPLVAAGLVLTVAAAVSIAAYLEARHIARVGAHQHVADVLQLVRPTSRSPGGDYIRPAHAVAIRPAIAEFVQSPDPARQPAALAALLERNGLNGSLLASEIRDSQGRVILSTNPAVSGTSSDFPPVIHHGDSGAVGPLRLLNDSIVYPISAAIPNSGGAYVVQWRHATQSAQTIEATHKLLGAGTSLFLGNADGSFWTDMRTKVPAPPTHVRNWSGPVEYTRNASAGRVVGGTVPLAGTPLVFAVELPLRQVFEPANTFLRNITFIALGLALIGALAGWVFARRLTQPLLQLTDAADAIALGRDTDGPTIKRTDELGRLANSFEVMSKQVRDSRQRLEDSVLERTRELHDALQKLQDAQETLVRREKLAMLGQLAGSVGHELRNPLGVMSNAIYYLEMVLGSSPDNVRDYLRLLREQVTLSSKIVGDLLGFARITPAERRPVALRDLVEAQLLRLSPPANVSTVVALTEALPPAKVDATHIGQVLFNLLTNAVQAMEDSGGEIRVAARVQGTNVIELEVADTGPGIPAELRDRIFEPLFTTKARGIGLGLAVSRALAQANDGDISLASRPGRGAVFILTLPAEAVA